MRWAKAEPAPAHAKPPKMDPYQKAKERVIAKQLEQSQRQATYLKNQADRQQKLQKRAKNSKLLAKKTKKGQPIMKNQIDYLLIYFSRQ